MGERVIHMDQEVSVRTVANFFDRIVTTVSLVLYVLMILVVGLQIMARTILDPLFGISYPWTLNLAQFLLVYITFIGAAVASGKREHISLDLLSSRLSDRVVRVFTSVQTLLILAFVMVMIAGAYPLYQQNQGFSIGALPAHPPFTQAWLYVPVIVGGVAIILYRLRDLWLLVRRPQIILGNIRRDYTEEEQHE
jgi:TRAP-type C4-dicarboxylate transport system permease small subunit